LNAWGCAFEPALFPDWAIVGTGKKVMKMRSYVRAGCVAAAVCWIASFGYAETITATLNTLTPSAFPTVELSYPPSSPIQITGGAGSIGWINGVTSNPTGDPNFTPSFNTYCIDLLQDIYFGHTYTYVLSDLASGSPQAGAYPAGAPVSSPMGSVRAADITRLYDLHYADTLGANPTDNKTAFQLAIWNLIYDASGAGNLPDATVSNGNFFVVSGVSSSVITTANNWLADVLNSNLTPTGNYTVDALVGQNGAQDQIYATPSVGGNVNPAPAPRSLSAGVMLLSLVTFMWWRSRSSVFLLGLR
jgi:hypothetical protein